MDIEIPQSSGSTLSVPLKCGDRLFMVGANGSGKSALIQHFVESLPRENIRRVTAHRQTWLQSGNVDLTPQGRKNIDEQTTQQELQSEARWTDQHGQQKLSAVLFDLVAKKNARNDTIAQHVDNQDCKAAVEVASQLVAPFDQMNELLALGTLMVSLELSGGEKITARHRHSNTPFSIAEMSDGERSAAIIAATVLTVEPGTVLLIDEPERHLHRAIIVPFLSALFEQRKDCTFIVSTHELALPIANPGAPILTIRSCDWEGDEVKAWDIVLLEAESELPEELKKAVLRGQKKNPFCGRQLQQPGHAALHRFIY